MAKELTVHDKLTEIANNLWWCWQPEVEDIFRRIDTVRFTELSHNPVQLLQEYTSEKLEKKCREEVLHTKINWAYRRFREYII